MILSVSHGIHIAISNTKLLWPWDNEERWFRIQVESLSGQDVVHNYLTPHKCKKDYIEIILVNDRYDLSFSIKDDEHERRASKHCHIPAIYPKPEDYFPGAADFNKVMASSPNNVRLQGLVKEQMKTQANRVPFEMISCVGQRSTNLSNWMDDTDFVFQHTEAE